MRTLWFVVPAHGRIEMSAVCLRQLALTCESLADFGVRASAVVIADDLNLDIAHEQGFATVERNNVFLGRKWNDGYQAAASEGVEYVVPLGTDDWVWPELFKASDLPGPGEVRCHRQTSVVSEDGRRIASLRISYEGGDGVRVWPTRLFEKLNYRPACEDRTRAIDTSVLLNMKKAKVPFRISYYDRHPLQIVDFKSTGQQLNSYKACLDFASREHDDPWEKLAARYPAESVERMQELYLGVPA